MPRRVGLPGASELFRPTDTEGVAREADAARAPVSHSGRVRHDEKITVYVSSEELLALEHLRLELRAEHGIAVDRGRIVRAAIASALADVSRRGAGADVVERLLEP
ncbi:hypothetical protein [Propioniciclava soli]|uniref:Ribbon-helix-helix protein, CopG family n=1 Tax=Propioniciclava soli TaxID=2775081 RepID=A0ABZ3CAX5_9ACTN|nr:hypothetical protein [Propioniciclava soli]